MHPELEKLIDMVVADGQITEKERAVVIKKAIALDVDPDEAEIYLDGRLHQIIEERSQIVFPAPPIEKKSNKEGDLKKCPACGAPVESFKTKCEDCGHEFKNISAVYSSTELFNKINAIEQSRNKEMGLFSVLTETAGLNNIDTQKKELIKNFPIPNTKEDILEFLTIAVPLSKKSTFLDRFKGNFDVKKDILAPIWLSKCEQIIMKARLSMKEDKKTLEEIEYYAKQLNIK